MYFLYFFNSSCFVKPYLRELAAKFRVCHFFEIATKILLVMIVGGCSASPWNISYLEGGISSRLSYLPHDKVNHIGIEMVCAQESTRVYLEVYAQSIPPYQGNEKEALVVLKTKNESFRAIAHRHAGGQRVLLPLDLQEILIKNLQEGSEVTLSLQGYQTTLPSQQFASQFSKLKKSPFKMPLQFLFKL